MRPYPSAKNDEGATSALLLEDYFSPMKTPPATPEFANFTSAMQDILKVSPTEMKTRIEAHKESGKRLSKGSASLGSAASSRLRSSVAKRS